MGDDLRRQDDVMMGEIKQMLVDHIDSQNSWNKSHDDKAEKWRGEVEQRFIPMEDFVRSVSVSYKILLALAAFIGSVVKLWDYARKHWNP